MAQKSISLDESLATSHALLGSVYLYMRQYEKAIAAGKKSVELDSNGAMVHGLFGKTLSYAGRPDEAMGYLNKGIRFNPFPPYWYYWDLGRCYLLKGQYERALAEFKKAHHIAPESFIPHSSMAMAYGLLGRQDEARVSAEKSLEQAPYISIGWFKKTMPYQNPDDLNLFVDAMRKAGFPEGT